MSADPDKETACPKDELLDVKPGLEGDVSKTDEGTDKRSKCRRSVCFPDDDEIVTQYFEPANPWHDVANTTRSQLAAEYLDSCRRHNTMPIDSVLQQIRELPETSIGGGNRASRLLLGECSLTGAAPTDALEAVLSKVQFHRLEVEHAEIDDDAAEALFDMIEYYESAMVVSITGPRQFGIRGWQAVSRLIRKSADLSELEVSSGPLCGAHAHVIARALRPHACRLRALCLHRVQLSGDPLLSLVLVLKTNSSVRELRLPDNELMASDAQQLGTLLRFNNYIQLLDLSNNNIQDQGVCYIADALVEQAAQTPPSAAASPLSPNHYPLGLQESRGLAVLVLWNNQLTRNCAQHLSRALRSSQSLCVLNIGRNCLGASTANSLCSGAWLISLGLQCAALGPDAAAALAHRVRHDRTLQRLDLRDNNLGAEGLQAILSAMQENTTLTQIDLDDPEESTNLSENSELATISRVTREIRASCRRNEPSTHTPERRGHRKISLTCHTHNPHKNGSSRPPRLRSPAPSPAPSPAGSPVPHHQHNTRFSVTRVTPERESSNESVSPSTPTRPTYSSTPSRFKVMQVAEPPHIQIHSAQKRPSSRFCVTRNYDSMYNPSPTPSVSPVPDSQSLSEMSPSPSPEVMTSMTSIPVMTSVSDMTSIPVMTSVSGKTSMPVLSVTPTKNMTSEDLKVVTKSSQSVMTKVSPTVLSDLCTDVLQKSKVMTNPSTVTLTNLVMSSSTVTLSDSQSVSVPAIDTEVMSAIARIDFSEVSVPKMVHNLEMGTKVGANVCPKSGTCDSSERVIKLSDIKTSEKPVISENITNIDSIGKSDVKIGDKTNVGTNVGANFDKESPFESKFGAASILCSDTIPKIVPNTRFSISPIPDSFESIESINSEIAEPFAMRSQINVALGDKNAGPNKVREQNTQTLERSGIFTDILENKEVKDQKSVESKIVKDVKDLSDAISKEVDKSDVKSDNQNKTYSDVVRSEKYKDDVEQLSHSEEVSDKIVKSETKLVKNSVQVSDKDKVNVQISVTVVKESAQDEEKKEVKKDTTMQKIEEITEDLGNLIKEMKDISIKTKKKCTVDIKDAVPGINRDIILKKNKSESSLDSPDLEVSRLMNKKLIGSPFCDSSSSLEISGSSMESLYTEGQNPQIQRPIVIQESVESDSELDRRKETESSMDSNDVPVNYLNMSVSSNESVSPIIFGKKKKIHDSLSSLEASMSSIDSNKQEKMLQEKMVTSADSGIEYSLQQQTEHSNEGTLTHNSMIEVKLDDTITSPKRTSSLLDVPALKTKGLDRMRKISWVAPSSSFHIPKVDLEKEKPSHLEKLLSLFQHPTSIFSRSQSDEERKSASNTPPRKDSSLTSSFWSWGSTIEKEKEDKEDSSEATDSTLSERVQVSFVDESFSKKLDKTPSTDTDTLSEFQEEKNVTSTTEIVQKCSLSLDEKASDSTDLSKPNEKNDENKKENDKVDENRDVKLEPIRPRSFAAVLKSSGSDNSLDKPSPDSGQPIDKLSSKVIRGIKENISPENTLTSSMTNTLATELAERQIKEKTDDLKSDLAPIATIDETSDEAADNTVNIPLEYIDDVKLGKLVIYGPELEPKENVDFGKDALYLVYDQDKKEIPLAQELKEAESKMDLSPELVIDSIDAPKLPEILKSPVIPDRAKIKKSNSLEDLSQSEKSPKVLTFKIPEHTSPRDIPERRQKLRTMSGSSPKSLPESLNKPSPLSKIDSVIRKRKKVSSLGKMAKDSLLALNMSEEEIAEYRRSYVTSVESLRSLESVSEDANSQSGTSVDSRCRSCLRTSQESLMSLDSITEDCKCADSDKPRTAR